MYLNTEQFPTCPEGEQLSSLFLNLELVETVPYFKRGESLTASECVSKFLGSRNRLMSLVYHLIEGPAVQVGPGLYSVAFHLLLCVLLLARGNQITNPGSLFLVLQQSLNDSFLQQLLDVFPKRLLVMESGEVSSWVAVQPA